MPLPVFCWVLPTAASSVNTPTFRETDISITPCHPFATGLPVRDIAPSSRARELWVGLEENAALALLQNITIYALNLSQLREIRKRLMLPAGDNRFRYIAANSEHAP